MVTFDVLKAYPKCWMSIYTGLEKIYRLLFIVFK